MITTNRWGDRLFVLLDHNMTNYNNNVGGVDYQWRIGENPDQYSSGWWKVGIGNLSYAVSRLNVKCYQRQDIHTLKLCWLSALEERMCYNHVDYIECTKVFIDRVMTVDELRKTGDPLYRQLIACLVFNQSCNVEQLASTTLTEYDWMWYVLASSYKLQLKKVPEVYRQSIYMRLLIQIMFYPSSFHPDPAIRSYRRKFDMDHTSFGSDFFDKFYRETPGVSHIKDPRHQLFEFVVRRYNKRYRTQLEMPTIWNK